MPVSDTYREYVLDQLAEVEGLLPKKMFGGVGLYAGPQSDLFFGLVADDRLYFRVDDATRAHYADHEAEPFAPNGQVMKNYLEVPASILDDREAVGQWAVQAVAVARRQPSKKKPKRKSRP